MVQSFSTIDKKVTEIAQKYLNEGYKINTQSMRGSDGTNKLDLNKGRQFIRIWYKRSRDCSFKREHPEIELPKHYWGEVYTLNIGKKTLTDGEIKDRDAIIWTDKLENLSTEYYFTVGNGYDSSIGVTQDIKDVAHYINIRNDRHEKRGFCNIYDMYDYEKVYNTLPYLKIGFKIVKKLPKTKSIHLEHIKNIIKDNYGWTVHYTTPSGKERGYRIGTEV